MTPRIITIQEPSPNWVYLFEAYALPSVIVLVLLLLAVALSTNWRTD